MRKIKIGFICVHNSCRSQIAEALAKEFAEDIFESFSAGTELAAQLNQDAVRLLKQVYGLDMEKTQKSKLLQDIPDKVDILVTMGCNVSCPVVFAKEKYDWGLDDPTGKDDVEFMKVINTIEANIKKLAAECRKRNK